MKKLLGIVAAALSFSALAFTDESGPVGQGAGIVTKPSKYSVNSTFVESLDH
jgi:hypothetical protein